MKRCYGFILDGETEQARDFARRSLLGRTSKQYVHNALSKAGLEVLNDRENPREALLALLNGGEEFTLTFARENAPCLSPETHARLVQVSEMLPHQPVAALADDMSTYLAIALPSSLLRSMALEKRRGRLYMNAISCLFDDMGVPVKVLGGLDNNCYCVVDGPTGFTTAYRFFRRIILLKLISAGVIVLDPESTTVEYDVRVGPGTTIYAGALLQGRTSVGSGCTLYAGNVLQDGTVLGDDCVLYPASRLRGAHVGDRVTLDHCVLTDCSVGSDCQIGPYAILGAGTVLGCGCRVDSFMALEGVSLPDGAHVTGPIATGGTEK